jgi:DNA mismatch repair protein MutL
VNVHPAKAEIRFNRPSEAFEIVSSAVRTHLMQNLRAPGIEASTRPGPAPDVGTVLTEFFSGEGPPTAGDARILPELVTGKHVFQLHDRYLIEEIEDGILIIDQHALHERVLLEELERSYGSADLPRQRLLVPASIEVTDEEAAQLEDYRSLLEGAGFSFEPFGHRSVRLTAIPSLLSRVRPEALLRDFLDLLAEGGTGPDKRIGIGPILERLACRSAVRFGERLPDEQIRRLLERRDILENPHVCAHGRPIAIRLSLDELDRFFRRRS